MESKGLRRSKRLSKAVDKENESDEIIKPVAASSPKSDETKDHEEEAVIKQVRGKLEEMKRDMTRSCRLHKFRLGTELCQQPFSKEMFAKNVYEFFHNSKDDRTGNSGGDIGLSFRNFASSTVNSFNERKNKKIDNFKHCSKSRIFKDDRMFEIPKARVYLVNHSGSNGKKEDTKSSESTGSSSSRNILPKKKGSRQVALVTPCPEVNRPLSVLRRPTAGELAVSLFGSPLLVAPDCAPTSMPQINLPTADGKVLAILPRDGFTVDDLPLIATPTRHQLKTLNKYLNDVCHQQASSFKSTS